MPTHSRDDDTHIPTSSLDPKARVGKEPSPIRGRGSLSGLVLPPLAERLDQPNALRPAALSAWCAEAEMRLSRFASQNGSSEGAVDELRGYISHLRKVAQGSGHPIATEQSGELTWAVAAVRSAAENPGCFAIAGGSASVLNTKETVRPPSRSTRRRQPR